MILFTFLAVDIKFYNFKMFMLSFIFQITQSLAAMTFFIDGLVAGTFGVVIAYYQHLRINKINRQIVLAYKNKNNGEVYRAVKSFTQEHNLYCSHLKAVNDFWKSLFLMFIVTMIPINLIVMHQLLFEDIPLQLRLFYIICMIISDGLLFGVQYAFAQLSVKIHSMYAKLSRLQWCLKGSRMRIKIKLIMCFERLSSTKHRIGITMGSIVFTMPLFAKVILT